MKHQRRVNSLEYAGLEFENLAAGAFLTRRADDRKGARMVGQRTLDERRRKRATRGDQVVTAGVPDLGERVVLEQIGHVRRAGTGARDERRVHTGDRTGDVESGLREPLLKAAAGEVLGQRELWMVVNGLAERDVFGAERLSVAMDRGEDATRLCRQR